MKRMYPNATMQGGKYKGKKPIDIAKTDIEYLIWCEKQKIFKFMGEIQSLIQKHKNKSI